MIYFWRKEEGTVFQAFPGFSRLIIIIINLKKNLKSISGPWTHYNSVEA